MSVSRTWSVVLSGLTGDLVEVEADLSNQIPGFSIIGLADKAVAEAQKRVQNACANSELALPRRHVTVNLSPANLPKRGTGLDVAVAIAAVATELALDAASLARTVHIGELGLDGRLRPVPGVLPAVVAAARAGFTQVVVPWANAAEAALVSDVRVCGAISLRDVARLHGLDVPCIDEVPVEAATSPHEDADVPELAEVIGQRDAVDALLVAAAGRHHVMMSGPPGAGKTTRLPPALMGDGPVLLVQPRRVAARSVARRIAAEQGWTVGEEIGWQMRFDRKFGPRTRLLEHRA